MYINFLNVFETKRYDSMTIKGALMAKTFNRTFRQLLEKFDCERSRTIWIEEINPLRKKNNESKLDSNKLIPIESTLENNAG